MSFWVSLIVVIVILIELVFVLDIPSAFTGVGCTFLMMPAMIVLAQKFAKYRGQTAASTDNRVRYISEVIDGIASVKSYAWETAFFQMIRQLRAQETKYIARSQVLRAVNQGLMFCTAAVVAFATFGVYWGNGGTLTIPLVFATIALLQVLRFQIGRAWTRSIETGSEAIASCVRIEKFLDLNSAGGTPSSRGAATTGASHVSTGGSVLEVKSSSYRYGSDDTAVPVLKDVSFSIARGELLVVVGPVGSGKSSLLSVALGELHPIHPLSAPATPAVDAATGSVGVELTSLPKQEVRVLQSGARIAYCAQRPWILAASVKSNITLAGAHQGEGKVNYKNPTHVDQELYRRAVESSLIVDDMAQWPAYDDTEVGERGISVSGGQKARISLARAIYADADCEYSCVRRHSFVSNVNGSVLSCVCA
jgi:ABC-type multidrug transport system fused ATPase/permease subunit